MHRRVCPGDEDDRRAADHGQRAEPAGDRVAVEAGQVDIQEDQRGPLGRRPSRAGPPRSRGRGCGTPPARGSRRSGLAPPARHRRRARAEVQAHAEYAGSRHRCQAPGVSDWIHPAGGGKFGPGSGRAARGRGGGGWGGRLRKPPWRTRRPFLRVRSARL
jgi:hypothetical protein